MKIETHSPRTSRTSGFGFIDMLVALSVIGIIVSIVLPFFGGDITSARQARDQRNAQNFCTLCTAAEAAGLDLVNSSTTVQQVLESLADGVIVSDGPLAGVSFKLPGVDDAGILGAAKFLAIEGGELLYRSNES